MHLIRPVGEAEGAGAGVETGERSVLTHAGTAVDLDGGVDDGKRCGRCGHFTGSHGASSEFDTSRVEFVRGLQREQSSAVQRDATLTESLEYCPVFREWFAEGDSRFCSRACEFQRALTHADQSHAMM